MSSSPFFLRGGETANYVMQRFSLKNYSSAQEIPCYYYRTVRFITVLNSVFCSQSVNTPMSRRSIWTKPTYPIAHSSRVPVIVSGSMSPASRARIWTAVARDNFSLNQTAVTRKRRFYYHNNVLWRVDRNNEAPGCVSPFSYYCNPLRSKYFPQWHFNVKNICSSNFIKIRQIFYVTHFVDFPTKL